MPSTFLLFKFSDLEVRFRQSKALQEGLFYAIVSAHESAIELESARQSVEYNKIQTVALTYHKVEAICFGF